MGKMKPRKRRLQGNSQREGEGRAKPAREREGPNPDIREGKKGKCAALQFDLLLLPKRILSRSIK